MAYKIVDQRIGMQPISTVSTVLNHPLGTEVRVSDPDLGDGVAVYCAFKTATAVAQYSLVTPNNVIASGAVSPYNVIVTAVSTHKGLGCPLFVTLTAVTSVTGVQYGWCLVVGQTPVLKTAVAAGAIADVVTLGTTAGRINVSVLSGDTRVIGVRLKGGTIAAGVSTINVYINRAHTAGKVV